MAMYVQQASIIIVNRSRNIPDMEEEILYSILTLNLELQTRGLYPTCQTITMNMCVKLFPNHTDAAPEIIAQASSIRMEIQVLQEWTFKFWTFKFYKSRHTSLTRMYTQVNIYSNFCFCLFNYVYSFININNLLNSGILNNDFMKYEK